VIGVRGIQAVGRDYTRKAEGTGLGLALTRRFVELHGGAISLSSTLGKGSTFTSRYLFDMANELNPDRRGQRQEHEARARYPAGKGLPHPRSGVRRSRIALVAAQKPDLVLMDIHLPA